MMWFSWTHKTTANIMTCTIVKPFYVCVFELAMEVVLWVLYRYCWGTNMPCVQFASASLILAVPLTLSSASSQLSRVELLLQENQVFSLLGFIIEHCHMRKL